MEQMILYGNDSERSQLQPVWLQLYFIPFVAVKVNEKTKRKMDLTDTYLTDCRWKRSHWHIDRIWHTKVWITQRQVLSITQTTYGWGHHTAPLQPRQEARMWADSSQSGPNASSWQSFFFRCFRKSMWWKGSFPPKPRWRLCCSFCLGGSINLHPDLVHAAALQHGSLMRSTSPMMEALPRLHQISKTDTPVPLTPTGGEARHQCCPLMQSNVCFLDSPLHCRPCQRTLCRPPWRNPGISGVNIYLFRTNLKALKSRNGKVRMESICKGKGEALKLIGWNSIILLHSKQICYS